MRAPPPPVPPRQLVGQATPNGRLCGVVPCRLLYNRFSDTAPDRASPLCLATICDNEERFLLGGAAHRPLRRESIAGLRAGERKTGWTKPLPLPAGLWALNSVGSCFGMPSGYFGRRLRGISRAGQAFGRSAWAGSDRMIFAPTHQWPVRPMRPGADLASASASSDRNAGAGS